MSFCSTKPLQLHAKGEDILKRLGGFFNIKFYVRIDVLELEPTAQQHALASTQE